MVSRRYIKGRALMAAAATSFAAVGMIALSTPALADDASGGDASSSDAPKCVTPLPDGSCPAAGTPVVRSTNRGLVNAGPSSAQSATGFGKVFQSKGVASAQAPVLNNDGNAAAACFANGFNYDTCGLYQGPKGKAFQ